MPSLNSSRCVNTLDKHKGSNRLLSGPIAPIANDAKSLVGRRWKFGSGLALTMSKFGNMPHEIPTPKVVVPERPCCR